VSVGAGSRRCACAFQSAASARQRSRSFLKSAMVAFNCATSASVSAVVGSTVAPVAIGGNTRWNSAGSIAHCPFESRCADMRPALMARSTVDLAMPTELAAVPSVYTGVALSLRECASEGWGETVSARLTPRVARLDAAEDDLSLPLTLSGPRFAYRWDR
jgi:hypothetical protein